MLGLGLSKPGLGDSALGLVDSKLGVVGRPTCSSYPFFSPFSDLDLVT